MSIPESVPAPTDWWRDKLPEAVWPVFEDFPVFLGLCWVHLNLPIPTPVQQDIARYIQCGPRRRMIQAFRGVGKSWITSAYVCWRLLRHPQINILVVSASKERSDQFTTFTLMILRDMDILKHLYPEQHQRNSKISFDVAPAEADHAPSVKSVGILGQMTGSRADLIIADDSESPNNSDTQMMREKLAERVKEFDAVLKPGGEIVYLGTPQTEDSLYNRLEERGYEIQIWPSQVPNPKTRVNYGPRLAPFIAEMEFKADWNGQGQPTDPRRFHREDLMERESSYGRSGYALQFMLDTTLSDQNKYPLRLSDLIIRGNDRDYGPEKVIWANEARTILENLPMIGFSGDRYLRPMDYARDDKGNILTRPYSGTVMAIDPSGRGKDETVWCVLKMLNSQLFLMEMGATREGYSDGTLQTIADCALKHGVNEIVIEANFGDGMFEKLLTPFLSRTHPVTTTEVKHSTQKEKRIIDTLEPVMNQHRLIVDSSVVTWDYESTRSLPPEQANGYRLFYQLTRMTRERGALVQDDRVDCLAIGVAYWVEQMALDIDRTMEQNREDMMDEELRRFVEGAQGSLRSMVGLGYGEPDDSSSGFASSFGSQSRKSLSWLG